MPYTVPTWGAVSLARHENKEPLNPIERFVYHNEPAGEEQHSFRKDLKAAIAYAVEQTTERDRLVDYLIGYIYYLEEDVCGEALTTRNNAEDAMREFEGK